MASSKGLGLRRWRIGLGRIGRVDSATRRSLGMRWIGIIVACPEQPGTITLYAERLQWLENQELHFGPNEHGTWTGWFFCLGAMISFPAHWSLEYQKGCYQVSDDKDTHTVVFNASSIYIPQKPNRYQIF